MASFICHYYNIFALILMPSSHALDITWAAYLKDETSCNNKAPQHAYFSIFSFPRFNIIIFLDELTTLAVCRQKTAFL